MNIILIIVNIGSFIFISIITDVLRANVNYVRTRLFAYLTSDTDTTGCNQDCALSARSYLFVRGGGEIKRSFGIGDIKKRYAKVYLSWTSFVLPLICRR